MPSAQGIAVVGNYKTKRAAYANGQLIGQVDQAGAWLDAVSGLPGFRSSETGTSQVRVQSGDTLASIAQRLYGTDQLWYVLAAANALDANTTLVAGTTLKAPEVTTAKNDSTTFRPYNPEQITGNSSHYTYIPPPKAGCSVIAMIIRAVEVHSDPLFTGCYNSRSFPPIRPSPCPRPPPRSTPSWTRTTRLSTSTPAPKAGSTCRACKPWCACP